MQVAFAMVSSVTSLNPGVPSNPVSNVTVSCDSVSNAVSNVAANCDSVYHVTLNKSICITPLLFRFRQKLCQAISSVFPAQCRIDNRPWL